MSVIRVLYEWNKGTNKISNTQMNTKFLEVKRKEDD